MLWDWLSAIWDDTRRGDERAPGRHPAPGAIPPVLRRRTVYVLAWVAVLGVMFGTLAPFEVDPNASWRWGLSWHPPLPGDAAANVLLYLPLGILARLMVRRRGSVGWIEWLFALPFVIDLSYLSEACQTVLMHRVGSWTDVCCNAAGAALGVALAPFVQRVLRNQHAWFYLTLRGRPYRAGAAAVVACLVLAALMPFDFRPVPHQVADAAVRFCTTSLAMPWTQPDRPDHVLSVAQLFDKTLAAAAFGLTAFWLVLSLRESRRSREDAVAYALTRTMLLAVVVESLQMLTRSHVADPRDLLMAWACAGGGAAMASGWLVRRRDRLPSPAGLLRGLLVWVALAVACRLTLSALALAGHAWPGMHAWLPMAGVFGCSWNHLLVLYCGSFAQYLAVGALLALWWRTHQRYPSAAAVVGAAVLMAAATQILALAAGHPVDTSQPILAIIGGAGAVRLDRALFGYRATTARTHAGPSDPTGQSARTGRERSSPNRRPV